MGNLGQVMASQGKLLEAEQLHRETLRSTEIPLGKEITSMNDLALILSRGISSRRRRKCIEKR